MILYGGDLEFLNKCRRDGKKVPCFDTMPILIEEAVVFWEAFQVLNSSRSVGFSANPLSLVEIECCMRLFNIESIEFVFIVKTLDRIMINAYSKSSD